MTDGIQDDAWRAALRQRIKTQRAALDNTSLDKVSIAVCAHLSEHVAGARHVAAYVAINGEVPVDDVLRQARLTGSTTYVPVVTGASMQFVAIDDRTPFVRNRFGIEEPVATLDTDVRPVFDIVLVPLVAFDSAGHRLGMGGGFYDRYFADAEQRPRLIGIAHEFQRVDHLQPMPWDVPLDGVVTENGWLTPL